MEYRVERDSMGEMQVPADRYWGAQTQRSKQNFVIGGEIMPREITHAFGILKKAAAIANNHIKPEKMDAKRLAAIEEACDEVIAGKLNDHFPLVVWQTGSGTQSNMNANEVIANRANEILGEKLCHPNDHINMSQSSNDTFPTAMHISAVLAIEDKLIPAVEELIATFRRLEAENEGIVKSGRTHLQDATPIKFSQEISGWRASLERDIELLRLAAKESGLAPENFEMYDEVPTNSLLYSLSLGNYGAALGNFDIPIHQKIFLAQFDAIQKLADRGESCVIIGRCADYALSQRDRIINVFLRADIKARVQRMVQQYSDLNEKKAADQIVRTDKRRASYHNFYADTRWGSADSYDLVIDSLKTGIDNTVELLARYVDLRYPEG